jgi:hypothetical protein
MQLEQSIQSAILALLRAYGIFCYKHQNSGIYSVKRQSYIPSHTRGVSDIIGCLKDGRFLAIEVKRPGGRPTPEQTQFIDMINQNGGLAFVAHSVEEVQEQLHEYLRPNRRNSPGSDGQRRAA